MISAFQLNDLIGSIYDAALEPSEWSEVVEAIRDAVGGSGALLFEPDCDGQGIDFAIFSGLDPNGFAAYAEHYFKCDVWQSGAKGIPAGQVVTGRMLSPVEEFVNSEFYGDFLRRHDIFHLLAALLWNRGGGPASMSIYRPRRKDDFDEVELSTLRLVTPHLQRAMQLQRHIGALERERAANGVVFDQLPFGVLFVDRRQRIILANRVAERLIESRDGLVARKGKLVASSSDETSSLRRLLSNAVGPKSQGSLVSGGSMLLTRPSMRRPLQVLVAPIAEPSHLSVGDRHVVAIVFVFDPERRARTPSQTLQDLYGLTPAEARLVATFVANPSLKAISERLNITEGGARVAIKRIFAKTGVHSQAALMKLVLTGPAALQFTGDR